MRRAVAEYRVLGIKTNLGLFAQLMSDPGWIEGDLDTGFLERFMQRFQAATPSAESTRASMLAAAQAALHKDAAPQAREPASQWRALGRRGLLR
jgi:acetyl/propionyl-CoA carboxylase alpha subunit